MPPYLYWGCEGGGGVSMGPMCVCWKQGCADVPNSSFTLPIDTPAPAPLQRLWV